MRLYRALLHLYPASFRGEYGNEMAAVFAMRRRQASGLLAVLALWIAAPFDVLINAIATHWDVLVQDLRYTQRTLSRAPGFAVTAILVTALGVGANTAAFSIADFVLIRPLPFKDAERLVKVWSHPPGAGRWEVSPPNYRDWKAMSHSFEAMGSYHSIEVNLVGEGDPQRLQGSTVTADLLPMLGVRPVLGRLFTAAEERDGAAGTVLLSHGLWNTAFGGDTGVLGRRVLLDGTPRVVIGVMPKDFHFPNREVALWTPIPMPEQLDTERDNNELEVLAKLKRGVTMQQAQADMSVVAALLERQYPQENEKIGASVIGLRDELSNQSRLLLLGLCGASICVLLIACTNLANLLLARALVRRRELVVRNALGAGRERLVRQLVTESLVLAILGGAMGIGVAIVAVPLLSRLVPNTLPIAQSPSVDLRVLLFAGLLTALTGIAFGTLPALRASGGAGFDALRDGERAGGGQRGRLRSALVIAEVMGCVVLLISSGLLMRALWRIQATDPGFHPENVITLRTALPTPKYDSTALRERFFSEVLSGVRALPGVSSAAYISFLPMAMGGGIWPVVMPGQNQARARAEGHLASMRFATPGFFAAMGIPLRQGREIGETDAINQPFVAVVSESLARQYFPHEDPLGKRFQFALNERTIVGVVGDIRVRGPERTSEPQVYLPYKQVKDGQFGNYVPKDLVIRSSTPPPALLPAIRGIVSKADRQQPISNVRTMNDIVSEQTASRAVQVRVLGGFALIAFLLAAVGIHGLLSFNVSQRRHEIGVRMALGAKSGDVVRMVVRQGVRLAAIGVIPGIAMAFAAGRGMEALLAGVKPGDAPTFTAAVVLCILMTLLGSLLPVLRAVRVAPATVFRGE
ncbi:MAG TPA: ABC transporter permease [Thermoanaerobaculia bacterium]|jgi:putative ABC transport system permease protein|nr:ABC transporter permease [Thermoanaerobaculia bacterium]